MQQNSPIPLVPVNLKNAGGKGNNPTASRATRKLKQLTDVRQQTRTLLNQKIDHPTTSGYLVPAGFRLPAPLKRSKKLVAKEKRAVERRSYDMGNDGSDDLSDYDRDKIRKQALVLETLKERCKLDSSIEEIRAIALALQDRNGETDYLEVTNLSGGYTNYTYKVQLKKENDDDGQQPVRLFVKLCFARAFWNPDPDYFYDTERIVNEKKMLEWMQAWAPGTVAKPYLLVDLPHQMKLLVTQWASPCDEPLAFTFLEGQASLPVSRTLAKAVAALHIRGTQEVAREFNTEARECMVDVMGELKKALLDQQQKRKAPGLSAEQCSELMNKAVESYRSLEILTHCDLHAFNCLVESVSLDDSSTRESDAIVICDWEMAMHGPLGLDMGRVYSIPVAALLLKAIKQPQEPLDHTDPVWAWMLTFWDTYRTILTEDGHKDNEWLARSYRNGLAWLGWKLFAISIFDWFIPFFPFEGDDQIPAFKSVLGELGLSLMQEGFFFHEGDETKFSLGHWEGVFESKLRSAVQSIQELAQSIKLPNRRRRSSIMSLRQSNRRVSDGFQALSLSTSLRSSISKALDESLEELDDK